jgi:c-di-AMP phosphodiesterase-like protein
MYAPYRKYIVELAIAMVMYTIAVFVTTFLLSLHPNGLIRILIALLPMIPFCFALIVAVRLYKRVDEFHRKFQLETLSFAFAGTAVLSFAYGWLQLAGFPQISWFYVWVLMGIMWIIGGVWSSWRYR